MNNVAFLMTSLLYIAALTCSVIGVYLLYINIDANLNKLAFLFCSSLCCWCIGAARSLIAFNYEDSISWRRFAAIGVGTFYGFFLHYIIILTEREQLMKKRWIPIAIYSPSVITVYFFGLSDKVTHQLYHLEKTPIGWISTSTFNAWSLLFDSYIMIVLLLVLYMVHLWKIQSKESQTKKQANLIFIACFISLLVSIIVETLDKYRGNGYVHEVAPLILIIPMFNVCYAIQRHQFMKAEIVNDDSIFMERFRTKITQYLVGAFCVGGILYFVSEYMYNSNSDFYRVLLFSLILCLFGLVTYVVQKFVKDKKFKIILSSIILSICIPVITLRYLQSTAITVWAFPFIIIIAALLFNNSTVLVMVCTSMILTQLYMWITIPNCVVTVESSDFFARIGLMGMAICLVCYINRVYLLRLSQLSDKIREQDVIFLISSHIINVNNNNLKEKMDEVLSLLCEYVHADRAHIYYKNDQEGMEDAEEYYYWCNELSILDDEILQDRSIMEYSWWKNQVKKTGIVQIYDVLQLPQEAISEKGFLMKQDVKSMIAVPLIIRDQKIGFLRIDYVANQKKWNDEFIKMLVIVGNILGEANIRASSEKKMEHTAYYDHLTNIPNRQLFGVRINQAIKTAGKNGTLIGIIFLDLDSFKIVNDTIGHHSGDKMLVMIAEKLTKCLRKTDTVCRFEGDEFLIMLNDVSSKEEIEMVVKKIVKQFEQPLLIEEQEFNITVSIGISTYPVDGTDKDTLIKNADIAMYQAKNNGKNQYVFCSREMKDEIQQTMILTNYLYHAQDRDEIKVVYQPQVSIESGRVVAMEALARWNHPDLGMISPTIFIPIAERTGLINSMGEWILRETCIQNKIWQEMGLPPVRVAVNVSVNQLLDPNFVSKVMNVLEDTELEPRYLELEVTENIAIQESEFIVGVLSELKKLGISLAIDDFGTEYSSLSRIKMLPVDRLKIDMHFISGILKDQKDKVIVDVIIKLAKDLKLKVIAEGVEQEEQLHYLKQKNCDEVQGYYFYKPLSKEDMQNVLLNMK